MVSVMDSIKIVGLDEFNRRGRSLVFKEGTKQVLLLGLGDDIFALDNRCPHEGYPLSEGTADGKSCLLTCNWHNWKFDLRTGKCVMGADHVRTYPVQVMADEIRVDLSEPDAEMVRDRIMEGFQSAFKKRQYGRMARELARLMHARQDPLYALKKSILWSFENFEYGMGHSYAALADWLQLYLKEEGREERLICLTEGIDHISQDILRQPVYSYSSQSQSYSAEALANLVEEEKAKEAEAMVAAGFAEGLRFKDFEEVFASIALEHYNDFGHSLIYVYKASQLAEMLDDRDVDRALGLSLIRSLSYTTREDLIPEFRGYAPALQKLRDKNFGSGKAEPPESIRGKSLAKCYDWLVENLEKYTLESLYDVLLGLNAESLLRYDLRYQEAVRNPVSKNVGWLDFTHALTFSNAVRAMCERYPDLWKKGLLQMMSFYGRSNSYLDDNVQLSDWRVDAPEDFYQEMKELIFDHGLSRPIFSAHIIKTALAIFEEATLASSGTSELLLAGLKRFVKSPLKQKHVRRTVFQSLSLVDKG